MFKHYLIVALRNLSRNTMFSLINMLGLAVGMGVCLLIFQYIHFEMSYDRFHANAESIYRITTTELLNEGPAGTEVYTPYALGVEAKESIPGISDFVRLRPQDIALVVKNPEKNEPYFEERIAYVDPDFFGMFHFPLKHGSPESVLDNKYSLVITDEMATKYFGSSNPIGKVLKINGGALSGNFTVTGVLEPLPANSHLQYDFLLPMKFVLEEWRFYRDDETGGWEQQDFITYVKLKEAGDTPAIGRKINQLIQKRIGKELEASKVSLEAVLQPLLDIHLKSTYARDPASHRGNIQDVQFFFMVALFILLMAWVNYLNLSTSQAMQRAKEVGVRKSIGAAKKQLITQFMVEALLINFIAALLSVGIAFLMLPVLNEIIGKGLEFSLLQYPEFWGLFLGVSVGGALLSGLYPAFVLSSFKPVSVFSSGKVPQSGGFGLRKGLIVFQFLVSVLLISGTYLVYKQVLFIKDQELGIDIEEILVVEGPRVFLEELNREIEQEEVKYKVFKNEIAPYHAVQVISSTSSVPGKGYFSSGFFRRSGEEAEQKKAANLLLADTDFMAAYGLEFLAKAPFDKDITPDEKVIINEEAVKAFGFESAEDALHKSLVNNYGDTIEVVGVVKNIHWSSLKEPLSPDLYLLNNSYGAYFSIRINQAKTRETIAHIAAAYHKVFPNDPFNYSFLNDDFNQQYQADLQFRNLFTAFSVLAIFIACLGLFSLVSYSAILRVKEIAIRKVLGASVGNMMILLSREYLLLLLIANVLAVPLLLYWGRSWLNHFAFRIEIGADLFLIPALVLMVISLLTVSYRTYATASANPVKSLRKE